MFLTAAEQIMQTVLKPNEYLSIKKINEINKLFIQISFYCLQNQTNLLIDELDRKITFAKEIMSKGTKNLGLSQHINNCNSIIKNRKNLEPLLTEENIFELEISDQDIEQLREFLSELKELLKHQLNEETISNAS